MSRMLRNSRNDRATFTDTCGCSACSRGAADRMVRRMQRARESEEFRREMQDELGQEAEARRSLESDAEYWHKRRSHWTFKHIATSEDIDDLIDLWHDAGGAPDGQPVELRDYLGMTDEQYSTWLLDSSSWHPRQAAL